MTEWTTTPIEIMKTPPQTIKQAEEFPPTSVLAKDGLTMESALSEFMDKLTWGTYGRPAAYPVKYKKLRELDTEHLQNILATQRQIPIIMSRAIMAILAERVAGDSAARSRDFGSVWGENPKMVVLTKTTMDCQPNVLPSRWQLIGRVRNLLNALG